jgi:hypothetical protein
MRRRLLAAQVSGFVAAMACLPVCAQIYKCPNGNGFSLQQAPCAGLGDSGGRLLVMPDGRSAPKVVAASASASDVPKLGRVLGRTPRPSADVAAKAEEVPKAEVAAKAN